MTVADGNSIFQFNVKIDKDKDQELVDFLLFVRKNRKFNAVVRHALRLYMESDQFEIDFMPQIEMLDALQEMGSTYVLLRK